jgi:aryl-alcohol dehydrogenase-like predicted oxidoreductase
MVSAAIERITAMEQQALGRHGPKVSRIGLGCMGMSDFYGASDEKESIATIHAALDHGVTLLDTGDFYGMGHNEMLIGEALKGRKREDVVLSVKFGALRSPEGAFVGFDLRPAAIRNFLAYSLKRLKTDYIDIYRPARLDPTVPIEDVAGTIKDLIREGYVRHLGLSEMSAENVKRAHKVTPVSDLQIEYAIVTRGIEAHILPRLREEGIAITAYGVLSRGLISKKALEGKLGGNFLGRLPRFSGDNLKHNLGLVETLDALARERNVSVAQLAIAWALSRGRDIVPLIGARTRERLTEALGALAIQLSDADLKAIDQAVPPDAIKGDRYMAEQMTMLDSEKKPGS